MQRIRIHAAPSDHPATHIYQRWRRALEAQDLAGFLSLYADDACILGFDLQVHGREALEETLAAAWRFLRNVRVHSPHRAAAARDSILFDITMDSRLGAIRATHALVLRDGLIAHHFVAAFQRDVGDATAARLERR